MRPKMRRLLERRDGPAIRDTLLWFALLLGSGYATYCALGLVVGGHSLRDLCGALRLHFGFALA